jgi:hypothetical protein
METLAVTKKTAPVGAIGRDEEVATVAAFLGVVCSGPAAVLSGPAARLPDGDIGVPEDGR